MATEQMTDLISQYLHSLLDEYQFSIHQRQSYGGIEVIIEYRSEAYKLRFINDRSEIMVDVGINRADMPYHYFMTVISFVSKTHFKSDFSGSVAQQIERVSKLLLQYAHRVFSYDLLVEQGQELSAYASEWAGSPWDLFNQ